MQGPKEREDMPLGLVMALAQNPDAMQRFSAMTYPQQQAVIDQAHAVGSRQEIRALVASLARETTEG